MKSVLGAVGALALGLLTLPTILQPANAMPGRSGVGHVHMGMGPHLGSGPYWGTGPRHFNNVAFFHDHHHHHHRGVFFVDVPLYAYGYGYDYGYDCRSLRWRAVETGSPYWWHRYRECVAYY